MSQDDRDIQKSSPTSASNSTPPPNPRPDFGEQSPAFHVDLNNLKDSPKNMRRLGNVTIDKIERTKEETGGKISTYESVLDQRGIGPKKRKAILASSRITLDDNKNDKLDDGTIIDDI